MKSIFSLIITIVLGFMIWDFFAPQIQNHLPALQSTGSTLMGAFQNATSQLRGLVKL